MDSWCQRSAGQIQESLLQVWVRYSDIGILCCLHGLLVLHQILWNDMKCCLEQMDPHRLLWWKNCFVVAGEKSDATLLGVSDGLKHSWPGIARVRLIPKEKTNTMICPYSISANSYMLSYSSNGCFGRGRTWFPRRNIILCCSRSVAWSDRRTVHHDMTSTIDNNSI